MRNPHEVISEIFGTRQRGDNMPRLLRRGSRDDLGTMTKMLGLYEGVEVGTKRGEFAEILCRGNPNLHLRCVDPWAAYNNISQDYQDKVYPQAVDRLSRYNVTIIRRASMEAVIEFDDKSLDFVYIDGNHMFNHAMLDLIHWHEKVRSGGIMALHDYRPGQWAGVVQAVDAYTHCHDIRPWYVTREREPTAFWVVP